MSVLATKADQMGSISFLFSIFLISFPTSQPLILVSILWFSPFNFYFLISTSLYLFHLGF